MRRCLVVVVVVVVVLAVLAGAAQGASRRAAQLEDLAVARTQYVMKSMALSEAARRQALAYIRHAERQAGSYDDARFMTLVLKIPAFADNGHDYFDNNGGWWPSARLPFRVAWFPDGLLVTRTPPTYAALLGARITRVEGLTPAQLMTRLHAYFGGPDAYQRWNTGWALESQGVLYNMGLARSAQALRLRFAWPDGRTQVRRIAFVPHAQVPSGLTRTQLFQRSLAPDELAWQWRSAVQAPGEPFYLQQAGQLFRMAPLPDSDALYVQLRAHYGSEHEPFEPFIARVAKLVEEAPPRNLVLDLRFDSGGNSDLTLALMQQIAAQVQGRIYILIGQHTFSAGIVTAAVLKKAAGARAILVGDGVGDRLRWWSEGDNICLPNSRYCLHASTGLWDLEKGCAGEAGCYGDRFPAQVGTLKPDLPAPVLATDWLVGRDPALEAVRADLLRPH